MTKKLISIIVPVYNVERYIKKCIESIIAQSYKNIEILLIDDGSTDNTGIICDEYSMKDSRIKVFHKKNGGEASARNLGLELATGEFIGFVDGDDWIDSVMYENMFNTITKNNADVCICNYVIEKQNKPPRKVFLPFSSVLLNRKEVFANIISKMISPLNIEKNSEKMHGSICRLLIKQKIITNNNLYFPEDITIMIDRLFCIRMYFKTEFVVVDKGFYYHYLNHGNAASIKIRQDLFDALNKLNVSIERIVKEEKVHEILRERLAVQYILFSIMSVVNETHPNNKKSFKEKIEAISFICSSQKLMDSLARVNVNSHSTRKKIILKALQNNNTLFLFCYYSLATRIINIKKRII